MNAAHYIIDYIKEAAFGAPWQALEMGSGMRRIFRGDNLSGMHAVLLGKVSHFTEKADK